MHFLLETAPPENATALANAIVNIFPNDSMMDVLSYCIQLEVSKTGTSTNSLQQVQKINIKKNKRACKSIVQRRQYEYFTAASSLEK